MVRERLPPSFHPAGPDGGDPAGTGKPAAGAGFLEQCGQSGGESLLHHHSVAVGRYHALRFRQPGQTVRRRCNGDITRIEFPDRHDQQFPPNDPRAHLIPLRDLLRDLGVRVDKCLDLERAMGQLVLRELVDDKLAVLGQIAARIASRAIMFSSLSLGVMGSMRKNSVCGSSGKRIMM